MSPLTWAESDGLQTRRQLPTEDKESEDRSDGCVPPFTHGVFNQVSRLMGAILVRQFRDLMPKTAF